MTSHTHARVLLISALLMKHRLVPILLSDLLYIPRSVERQLKKEKFTRESKDAITSNPDRKHRFRDGRRYRTFDDGAYYLPNDEAEASR